MPITKASGNSVTAGAKGDLVVGSATNDSAILAVGNNGETLVADSSATTGLRWQRTEAGGKNGAINGNMVIAQRGTAAVNLSTTFQYPVDRFWATGNLTGTAQQISSISLDGFKNAVRLQRTAGQTSTNDITIGQTFESNASIPFQGKTITLSFWARAGANFSASSSTLNARVYTGTGTDQGGYGFSWTGTALPLSQSNTLTTSWQRFSVTGTIATTATQMQIYIFYTPSGTAGAADSFDITGVQLEVGSVATGFQTATGTLAGELAACQRYFQAVEAGASYGPFGMAFAFDTNTGMFIYHWKAKMRTNPTVTYSAAGDFATYDKDATVTAVTTIAVERVNAEVLLGVFDVGGTPYSGGEAFAFLTNAGSAAKINASAEL